MNYIYILELAILVIDYLGAYNIYFRRCASSVQIRQRGEKPRPVKSSKQPVHSLGAEAAR